MGKKHRTSSGRSRHRRGSDSGGGRKRSGKTKTRTRSLDRGVNAQANNKYGIMSRIPPQGRYKNEMRRLDNEMLDIEHEMTMLLWQLPGIEDLMTEGKMQDWDRLRTLWEVLQSQRLTYLPINAKAKYSTELIRSMIGNMDVDADGEVNKDEAMEYFKLFTPQPIQEIADRAFDTVDRGRPLSGDALLQFVLNYSAFVLDEYVAPGSGSGSGSDGGVASRRERGSKRRRRRTARDSDTYSS